MKGEKTKIGTSQFDCDVRSEITQLVETSGLNFEDTMENFTLFYRRVNFAKLLAQIEIFNKTIDLPGSIVELGVFKGASFMAFLKLLDIHCAGDTLKRIIGFDTFSGFTSIDDKDGLPDEGRDKVVGGFDSSDFLPVLERAIELNQADSFIPRFKRAELVKGDVVETIPAYVEQNPGLRISLLHLDLDLYEPTKVALEYLYPKVVPGGIILLDEYAMEGFPGESEAVEEYFKGKMPVIKKFPYISTPGGYFIKEG